MVQLSQRQWSAGPQRWSSAEDNNGANTDTPTQTGSVHIDTSETRDVMGGGAVLNVCAHAPALQ